MPRSDLKIRGKHRREEKKQQEIVDPGSVRYRSFSTQTDSRTLRDSQSVLISASALQIQIPSSSPSTLGSSFPGRNWWKFPFLILLLNEIQPHTIRGMSATARRRT
ncbi:hypothetical protein SDJN03_13525, partial [Cucurbita argyrosperma subsp. sororia]